jgi:hypothetical protein
LEGDSTYIVDGSGDAITGIAGDVISVDGSGDTLNGASVTEGDTYSVGDNGALSLDPNAGSGSTDPTGSGGTDPTGSGSTDPTGSGSTDPTGSGGTDPTGSGSTDPTGSGTPDPTGTGSEGGVPFDPSGGGGDPGMFADVMRVTGRALTADSSEGSTTSQPMVSSSALAQSTDSVSTSQTLHAALLAGAQSSYSTSAVSALPASSASVIVPSASPDPIDQKLDLLIAGMASFNAGAAGGAMLAGNALNEDLLLAASAH